MSVETEIRQMLQAAFSPTYLAVANESHGHNVPAGSETHFKVVIVTSSFDGLRRIECHRQVYEVLSAHLVGSVHALALHCYAPEEWQLREGGAPQSPPCQSLG